MTELLVRPGEYTDLIKSSGYAHLTFGVRKLAAGAAFSSETGVNELAVVVLGGCCSVESS